MTVKLNEQATEELRAAFNEGARAALRLIEIEAFDMHDIHLGYCDAMSDGRHAGRKIPKRVARKFASNFNDRADALYSAVEHAEKELGL